DERARSTRAAWTAAMAPVQVAGRTDPDATRSRRVLATALYHSLIKPALAADESPQWPTRGPYAFDICTMWDIYRTQLPLLGLLHADRAAELAAALVRICEEEGNFPSGTAWRRDPTASRARRRGSRTPCSPTCARRARPAST